MNKYLIIFLAIAIFILSIITIIIKIIKNKKEKFMSGEHVIAIDGDDNIRLKGVFLTFPKTGRVKSSGYKFTLDNGLKLTFGEIAAFAGDMFSTLDPISDETDQLKMQNKIVTAFDTLNADGDIYGDPKKQVPDILKLIKREITSIEEAINNNKLPYDYYYKALGFTEAAEYNFYTGGGYKITHDLLAGTDKSVINIIPIGRYMKLATLNWDHFGKHALAVYLAGHSLACYIASLAGFRNNSILLNKAYMIDAFSSHFLSDLFSAGHLRPPRKELHYGIGSPMPWSSTVGDYLTKLMHEEDCINGVLVSNNACYNKSENVPCQVWKAYGDMLLLDPRNAKNLQMVTKAVQLSVDEVWASFNNKNPVKSTVFLHIPNLDWDKIIPGQENNTENKTIGGTLGICNPKSCEDTLGPEWHKTGTTTSGCFTGSKYICTRNMANPVPMFKYNQSTDTMWKRSNTDNTMTPLTSGVVALKQFA